jgi:hypothetical protein
MTSTTNVPPIVWNPTGPVLPTEGAILVGVQDDINAAFGGGVNPGLTTPQGQLAQSLTAIVGDSNDQFAVVMNGVNPDTADGAWQDAIGRIYFIDRIPASGTVVIATCVGEVETLIPAGSRAQDTAGFIYFSTADATIPASGNVQVAFQNSTVGPIACAPGTLSIIYSAIDGWDTITNAAAGTPGTLVESRADFEFRRQNSVALNAVNTVQSVYANVLNVADVLDCFVIDNPKGVTVDFGATNYPLVKNSLAASVLGGAALPVATAIWNKKPPGCNYNGNTSQAVTDTSGYSFPVPTYTITWITPTAVPTYFAVQIIDNPALPADIVTLIQAAIVSAFNGQDGGPRARIASTIFAGRYYAGVSATDPNCDVLSILMSTTSGSVTATSVAYGIDQAPSLSASNISVTLVAP